MAKATRQPKKAAPKKRAKKATRKKTPPAAEAPVAVEAAAGKPAGLSAYEAHKERTRARQAELSLSGRDIGELPTVANPERKAACERALQLFLETYFPQTFAKPWSPDHIRIIERIQTAVLDGGLSSIAMPRGSGKTSICERACLWALLYGHIDFIALIGADERAAAEILDSIKAELEHNEELCADFPEACYPIRKLEGIHQRASGQLYQGRNTYIGWTANEVILPTIEKSQCSGGIVRVAGITGRIRGMKFTRPDGRSVRPKLVLIDDPQTNDSARSPSQCATRARILQGDILGLAGPGEKISGLMTCTVIRKGDLADEFLDRSKHPEWQGERTKLMYALPTNEKLWDEYGKIRAEALRAGDSTAKRATAFYRKHRKAMDEGAVPAWRERFAHDELSAVQHAMNLKLRNEAAFYAEYQNEPMPDVEEPGGMLAIEEISAKVNGHKRQEIPIGCSRLIATVDVQGDVLFYMVAAWEDDFTGYVIDYGTEPDQQVSRFTMRDARHKLSAVTPHAGLEGTIYAGLQRLIEKLCGREWRRDDGAMVKIDRCLIDANWGKTTNVVYQFCRQSPFAGVLMPSHGKYVGASSLPMDEYKRKRGDRTGLNWRVPVMSGRRAIRHVVYDTNYWKSFVHARLAVSMGDPGSLSLFGQKAVTHELLAEHLTAEYPVVTQGRGRTVDEWKEKVKGRDNHWLDCLVMSAVAASMEGCVLFGTDDQRTAGKKVRVKFSELQAQRRGRRR